jgi:WD40 repeat protein
MRYWTILLFLLIAIPLGAQEKGAASAWSITWDEDWVTAVTFVGKSRRVIAGNKQGRIVAWDVPEKAGAPLPPPVRRFDGHNNQITALATTPDGRWLVSTSYDHTIRLWDLEAPPKSKGTVLLRTGAKKKEKGDEMPVDVQEADKVLTAHAEWVRSLSLSPDGKLLLTGDDQGIVILWQLPEGRELKRLTSQGWLKAVALSPDARQALTCASSVRYAVFPNSLHVWDLATGKVTLNLGETLTGKKKGGEAMGVAAASFSPDGKAIGLAQGAGEIEGGIGKLFLVDSKSGKKLQEIPAHQGGVVALAFSPDGQHVASAGRDTLVKLWKVADGKAVAVLGKSRGGQFRDWIHAVAFSADGAWLAAGDMAGFVHLYSLKK